MEAQELLRITYVKREVSAGGKIELEATEDVAEDVSTELGAFQATARGVVERPQASARGRSTQTSTVSGDTDRSTSAAYRRLDVDDAAWSAAGGGYSLIRVRFTLERAVRFSLAGAKVTAPRSSVSCHRMSCPLPNTFPGMSTFTGQ